MSIIPSLVYLAGPTGRAFDAASRALTGLGFEVTCASRDVPPASVLDAVAADLDALGEADLVVTLDPNAFETVIADLYRVPVVPFAALGGVS